MGEARPHRGTILVEDAEVLSHEDYPGDQFVLRLKVPRIAAKATPGSFAHLTCDPALPMRRPLSIMRASPGEGWIELLYKVVGEGTRLLAMPWRHPERARSASRSCCAATGRARCCSAAVSVSRRWCSSPM